MDNVKDNKYYIQKILKDINFLIEKTKGKSLKDIELDEVLCDSIHFRLIQISENSAKLTDEFKYAHREIPWQAIKGMRNRIVHEYGDVKLDIVYQTVTRDIPDLLQLLENCL